MSQLIDQILSKIINNKLIIDDLQLLQIDLMSKDKSDLLLAQFLNEALNCGNIYATRDIIDTFDEKRINVDPLPAITNIFLNPFLDKSVLKFTISCFPNKKPSGYFLDIINMGDDDTAVKIANMLSNIFPDLSNEDWNDLLILTDDFEEEEYENQSLRNFFQIKVTETCNNMKSPEWVKCNIPKHVLPPHPTNIPSVKEAIDLLLWDLNKLKINIVSEKDDESSVNNDEDIRNMVISQYAISTSKEKICMISNIINIPIFDDIHMFQEFGPVNTIYTHDKELDPLYVCSKYGGCRMLLCNEFEDVKDDGYKIDYLAIDNISIDWFRKICDECNKKIPHKHYAVRQPLCHGGWKGCYCSFKCLEKNIYVPIIAVMIGRIK